MSSRPGSLFLLTALLLAAAPPLVCQQPAGGNASEFVIDDFKLETLPAGYFYPNFVEFLAPGATWLGEESDGFGLLDQPRVCFEGDSWTQFHWDYAGYAIDSALDDGAPALQLPFLAIGAMSLLGETPERRSYGLQFMPRSPQSQGSRSHVMVSSVFPDMGGTTFLGKLAKANRFGARAQDLYDTRRRIAGQYQFDASLEKATPVSSLLLAAGYFSLERDFNDFNRRDTQFQESGGLLQLLSRWQRRFGNGTLSIDLVLNAGSRDRLFAEFGRYPQETYRQDKRSWLAGASWTGRGLDLRFSWLQEWQERRPAVPNAGKDLQDIDGQAFIPFEKWGTFSATTLSLGADKRFVLPWLGREAVIEPYLDLRAVFHSADEETGTHNAIYFAGQPYLVYLWQGGGPYSDQRRCATAGTLLELPLGERVAFHARLFLKYQGLDFRGAGNDLGFLRPGGQAALRVKAGKGTEVSLSYGVLPYEMRAGVSDFLQAERPGAAIYYWSDANGDGLFQDGEQGTLYGRSGGDGHSAAPGLKPSLRERLELLLSTRLSSRFRLDVGGLYKRVRRQLWVAFAGDYGHYQEIDGQDYYLLDAPAEAFVLGNAAFAKDPYYAQFLVRLHGERERRWYFSLSFMAHIGMGYTAFGNGPEDNDAGVISESQAFPDSWINGYGRVDGDRAFVGKVFFGRYLSPRLFLGGSIRYRDGEPFAFIDAFRRDGQWVITYRTIRGEDGKGRKGGPREDCIWDFNFQLSYELSLFGRKARLEMAVFNLLDFGEELSENVFSGGERLANELQLPRSLRLGIELEL
jgi:hypothetical protein